MVEFPISLNNSLESGREIRTGPRIVPVGHSPKGRSATVYDALYWNLWSTLRLIWGWNECRKERNECGGGPRSATNWELDDCTSNGSRRPCPAFRSPVRRRWDLFFILSPSAPTSVCLLSVSPVGLSVTVTCGPNMGDRPGEQSTYQEENSHQTK